MPSSSRLALCTSSSTASRGRVSMANPAQQGSGSAARARRRSASCCTQLGLPIRASQCCSRLFRRTASVSALSMMSPPKQCLLLVTVRAAGASKPGLRAACPRHRAGSSSPQGVSTSPRLAAASQLARLPLKIASNSSSVKPPSLSSGPPSLSTQLWNFSWSPPLKIPSLEGVCFEPNGPAHANTLEPYMHLTGQPNLIFPPRDARVGCLAGWLGTPVGPPCTEQQFGYR
jgi:hypothetical protein